MRLEVRRNLGRRADEVLFELLGELAHQRNLDFAENLADFLDELVDIVRARVKNLRRLFVLQLFEQVDALGALLGRKVLEREVVCGHAARNKRGNHRAGPWNRTHVDAFTYALPHQIECGVGDARRSRVAHERDIALVFQKFHVLRGHLLLVEVVVGFHRGAYPVVVEQDARVSRVLGEHERDFLEDPHGAVGDVFHVPDGGRDNIESVHAKSPARN